MKVSCLQENLHKGLQTVGKAVATKTTLPVLNNILISTDRGRLKLSATNLEVGITNWIGLPGRRGRGNHRACPPPVRLRCLTAQRQDHDDTRRAHPHATDPLRPLRGEHQGHLGRRVPYHPRADRAATRPDPRSAPQKR